jgi:hypothetical protein
MKDLILLCITGLSVLTLAQIFFYLYSSTSSPKQPKIYFSSSEILETRSFNSSNLNEKTCTLQEPKYKQDELRKIFAPRKYSACKTATQDIVDFRGVDFYVQCEYGEPLFFVDPGEPQRFGGEVKDPVSWSPSSQLLEKSEYVFVKCGRKSVYAHAFNRFNKTVENRANRIRWGKGGGKKNFNVLLLVFDSLSRFVSYNFLNEFTGFIKEVKKSSEIYSVYEFKKIAMAEEYTLPNMAQILYGMTWDRLKSELSGARKLPVEGSFPEHVKLQREKSIWNHYSDMGYTTLFLYDTVWDFLSRFIGREILADHVFENFWRHAYDIYGWTDFSSKQRCMGTENSHNISFKYVSDYFTNYKNNNKFAYVHLSPTHESSGNVRTLDRDLKIFISNLLQLMKKRDEDLALYIISDHGWKFPDLILDPRYKVETLSPLTYLILSKEVEAKMNAKDFLDHNKEQLFTRFDMNLGLRYLAHYPYGLPDVNFQSNMKKTYTQEDVYNIFNEKIRTNRTCEDVGVVGHRCICEWFKDVGVDELYQDRLQERFSELLFTYFETRRYQDNCAKLASVNLIRVQKMNVQPERKGLITYYKVMYKINGIVEVKALFMYCQPDFVKKPFVLIHSDRMPFVTYDGSFSKVTVQLQEVILRVGCGDESCLCNAHVLKS